MTHTPNAPRNTIFNGDCIDVMQAFDIEHEEIVAPSPSPSQEFGDPDDEPDVDAAKARAMRARMRTVARQASLDAGDGIEL